MQSYSVAELSANQTVDFYLSGNPELINMASGRRIHRYAGGGRLYLYQSGTLSVTLEGDAGLSPCTISIQPASELVFGQRRYSGATEILFRDRSVNVSAESMTDPTKETQREVAQQSQAVQELETQLQALNEQAAALREQIADANRELEARRQELSRVNDSINTGEGNIQSLKQALEQANATLEQKLREEHELRAQVEALQIQSDDSNRSCISLQAEIKEWNRQIEEGMQRLETLQAQKRQKEGEYAAYSPAVLDGIQQDISQLSERTQEAERQYLELAAQKRVQDSILEKQQHLIEDVQQQIAAQPEALRELQAEYEQLSQRLEQIIRAETDCSEEKQQELRDQIAEREPISQELTQQYTILHEQSTALAESIARLQAENGAAIEALWPDLVNLVERLRGNVDEKNAQLDALREEALQFTQQVNLCTRKQESLTQWYQADRTPLQSLMDRMGLLRENENHQLLQTMSLQTLGRIGELFAQMESSMEEMDSILRLAVEAVRRDEKYLRLRAETNESQARAEMKKL